MTEHIPGVERAVAGILIAAWARGTAAAAKSVLKYGESLRQRNPALLFRTSDEV
jgi:hypothetical protein